MTQKEYQRKWKEKNPEKAKEIQRRYREKNREKIRESAKKYREKNRKKINEKTKQWNKENPEKRKEHIERYKDKKQGKPIKSTHKTNIVIENNTDHTKESPQCLYCKKEFNPRRNTARFCSTKCRVYYNRKGKQPPTVSVTI